MATSTSLTPAPSSNDVPTWDGLKRAILSSSGFQRWCIESHTKTTNSNTDMPQEQQVMAYLRETLETLAY